MPAAPKAPPQQDPGGGPQTEQKGGLQQAEQPEVLQFAAGWVAPTDLRLFNIGLSPGAVSSQFFTMHFFTMHDRQSHAPLATYSSTAYPGSQHQGTIADNFFRRASKGADVDIYRTQASHSCQFFHCPLIEDTMEL